MSLDDNLRKRNALDKADKSGEIADSFSWLEWLAIIVVGIDLILHGIWVYLEFFRK